MKANPRGSRFPKALLSLALAGVAALGYLWPMGQGQGQGQELPRTDALSGPMDRRPILLVPGWAGEREELAALKERFLRDGWGEGEVLALEFDDPVGSNEDHAAELEVALQRLLLETGAREADVVAHSMGGLAVWALLKDKRGTVPVRRVVFLGSPLRGTLMAYLGWGEGGEEMRPDSPFMEELRRGRPPQYWVQALTIRTPLDLNVVPGIWATLPGIGDRMVCCPTHQGLLDHEETYRVARDFLLGR